MIRRTDLPDEGGVGPDGKALCGEPDRRRQNIGQRQRAVALETFAPARGGAGYGHRMGMQDRQAGREAIGFDARQIEGCRGATTAVHGGDATRVRAVIEREAIAPEPGVARLGHRQGRGCRHGGVGRVSALVENAQAGSARQRLTRRNHAAPAEDRRTIRIEVGCVETQALDLSDEVPGVQGSGRCRSNR